MGDLIDREMKISAPLFLSPPEELSEEHLTKTDFEQLKYQTKHNAPSTSIVSRNQKTININTIPHKKNDEFKQTCHGVT